MIEEFLVGLPNAWLDAYGNIHVKVGKNPETIFSSHTDTVHRTDGHQKIYYDELAGHIFVDDKKNPISNCLGADDGGGVWLMREMILASKKGYYIFHRDEEIGGLGSAWLRDNMPELFKPFKRAIAFDRKGTTDIITSQRGGVCCSPTFCDSLALEFEAVGIKGMKSAHGSFTDTANYIHLVQECTNISIGYYSQHGPRETQDAKFLDKLRKAVLKIDWEELPTSRVAKKPWEPAKPYRRPGSEHHHYESSNRDYPSSGKSLQLPSGSSGVCSTAQKELNRKATEKAAAELNVSVADLEWYQDQLDQFDLVEEEARRLNEIELNNQSSNRGTRGTQMVQSNTALNDDVPEEIPEDDDDDDTTIADPQDIMYAVLKRPHAMAALLIDLDVTYEDLSEYKRKSKEHLKDWMS